MDELKSIDNNSDSLEHFGVLGMKWGKGKTSGSRMVKRYSRRLIKKTSLAGLKELEDDTRYASKGKEITNLRFKHEDINKFVQKHKRRFNRMGEGRLVDFNSFLNDAIAKKQVDIVNRRAKKHGVKTRTDELIDQLNNERHGSQEFLPQKYHTIFGRKYDGVRMYNPSTGSSARSKFMVKEPPKDKVKDIKR